MVGEWSHTSPPFSPPAKGSAINSLIYIQPRQPLNVAQHLRSLKQTLGSLNQDSITTVDIKPNELNTLYHQMIAGYLSEENLDQSIQDQWAAIELTPTTYEVAREFCTEHGFTHLLPLIKHLSKDYS